MGDDVVRGDDEQAQDASSLPAIPRRFFTRRRFITVAGGAIAGATAVDEKFINIVSVQERLRGLRSTLNNTLRRVLDGVGGGSAATSGRSLTFDMLRREDMLRLRFELYNLAPDSNDPNKLVRNVTSRAAYVVVTFPPQHLAEEALLRVAGQPHGADDPEPELGDENDEAFGANDLARLRLSGTSRIVFEVPASQLPLPRTQEGLLRWIEWTLKLAPGARTSNDSSGPTIKQPQLNNTTDSGETALELPWRLQLSPLPGAGWIHPSTLPAPSLSGGYSLWHTRLAARRSFFGTHFLDERQPRGVRALWNTDPYFTPNKPVPGFDVVDDDDTTDKKVAGVIGDGDHNGDPFSPFRTSLSPRNRVQIVLNSAGFKKQDGDTKVVAPIDVNRLMLSPLGGFLDVEGKWDKPVSTDLLLWRHRATLGRDVYVKVIERGFFMPWGFPGLRIKVTERVVEPRQYHGQTINVAFLRQRVHYVILDPTLDFPTVGHDPVNGDRDLPFRAVRSKTLITPDVADDNNLFAEGIVPSFGSPSQVAAPGGSPATAFRFDLEGTDHEGRTIAFRQPLAFLYASKVSGNSFSSIQKASNVRGAFNALSADHVLRTFPVNGQKMAFAHANDPGDTAYEANSITLSVGLVGNPGATAARFVPLMSRANVRIEAADTFSGKAEGGTDVKYPSFFLLNGFNANAGVNKTETFLQLVEKKSLSFGSSESTGGVASPSLDLTALSRSKGAIGGSDASQRSGAFQPTEWFPAELNPTMLGLKLFEVIDVGSVDKAMTLSTKEIPGGVQSSLRWAPDLREDPLGILKLNNKSKFALDANVVRRNDGTTTSEVHGEVKDVTLRLLGTGLEFLNIDVRRMVFLSRTGTSPDLDVELGEIKFVGALTFVNELREVLANKDGPFGVEVDGSGIQVRGGLSLPALTVGIFSLKNLALSVEVEVPFTPEPTSATFAISSKKDPFLVAVSIFGGGGWFSLSVDTHGLKAIEAGFEFGGVLAMDFGVAGGSIEVMAGIYFRFEKLTLPSGKTANKVTLAGYVRLHGEVHVGFVSVGLTAELDLTYVSKPREDADGNPLEPLSILTGRCEVTLELPVAPDVSFEIEKSFGGDPHDPRYVQQVTSHEWLAYVNAFKDEEDAA